MWLARGTLLLARQQKKCKNALLSKLRSAFAVFLVVLNNYKISCFVSATLLQLTHTSYHSIILRILRKERPKMFHVEQMVEQRLLQRLLCRCAGLSRIFSGCGLLLCKSQHGSVVIGFRKIK